MKITEELLEHINRKLGKDKGKPPTARQLAQEIARYQKIEDQANCAINLNREEKKRHHAELAKIDGLMRDNQKACDHPDTTYHVGSGSLDSWVECNICRAEIDQRSGQSLGYDG